MKISLLVEGSTTELAQAINALDELENPVTRITGHGIGAGVVTNPLADEVSSDAIEGAANIFAKKLEDGAKKEKATRGSKQKETAAQPQADTVVESKVVEAPVENTEPDPAIEQDQKANEAQSDVSLAEIRAVFNPVATTKREAVVALLAKFGAEKLTKFYDASTPEQHCLFFEELKKL